VASPREHQPGHEQQHPDPHRAARRADQQRPQWLPQRVHGEPSLQLGHQLGGGPGRQVPLDPRLHRIQSLLVQPGRGRHHLRRPRQLTEGAALPQRQRLPWRWAATSLPEAVHIELPDRDYQAVSRRCALAPP